jgi:AraC-like DNA-binding protein
MTLEELARELNYSVFHFLRLFKTSTGMTPFEYLTEIKIEKAKRLLRESEYTITEICSMCGFKYQSHFAQAFSKRTGLPPSLYRKNV